MRRISIILTVLCCLIGFTTNAQIFSKGDIVLNGTIGFGSLTNYSIGLPPIAISGEYCIVDNLFDANSAIGVGAYVGVGRYKHVHWNDYDVKIKDLYTRWVFGARGLFHYNFVDNLDTYAGLMLGVYSNSEKKTYTDNTNTVKTNKYTSAAFAYSLFIGARYYFTPNFGVVAEAGYGLTFFSLGVTYKL